MKKSPILVITVMAAIAATTGLLTALSMSETALAARSGVGFGCGQGGGSTGEPCGGVLSGRGTGGAIFDGEIVGAGGGGGSGESHCGFGGGGSTRGGGFHSGGSC